MTTEADWNKRVLAAEAKNKALMDQISQLRSALSTCESDIVRMLGELADANRLVNQDRTDQSSDSTKLEIVRLALVEWQKTSTSSATTKKIKDLLAGLDS